MQSDLQIALRGLTGTMFLKDLREKVHRGMSGNIAKGLSAGGKAYGYELVCGEPGELEIVEQEADVIRHILQEYAEGVSPRDIARGLNERGELPPRGVKWNASTLNGNAKRGYGILRNSLYAGVLVWDRVKMVRNPSNGRRVSREKPQDAWKYAEVPHLRIVDEDLWDAVQARLAKQSHAKNIGKSTRKPARPFSGLLKCGCCGGGMSIHDRKGSAIRLRCSTAKESGSCSNTGKVRLDKIEDALFENLRAALQSPIYIDAFIREYNAESRRISSGDQVDSKKLEREVKEAEALFKRRISLFEKGLLEGDEGDALLHEAKARVAAAREELKALEQHAEELTFDPASAATYMGALDGLFVSMRSDAGVPNTKARDAVRELVEEIIVSPAEEDGVPVEVKGRLSALVVGGLPQRLPNRSEKVGGFVVAEEGLEPPTRGL